jgi:hypothetical protein
MRRALLVIAAGCATDPTPAPEPPDLLAEAWASAVAPGDAVVAVPGTGTYSDLSVHIHAAVDPANPDVPPTIAGRAHVGAVEVLEAAIAAAQRAGRTNEELASGAVTFAIWGAGLELDAFHYDSLGGLRVTFHVIGGKSNCAEGGIFDNLSDFNVGSAEEDARDLYQRLQAWQPAGKVTLVAHSWGGVVAQYLASHYATFIADHGPGATVKFLAAGGVPAFIPKFETHGPGFRTVTTTDGEARADIFSYEIARPDDPIRTLDPAGNGGGHHYIIRFGDEYRGWYGITTDELSCGDVPGICPRRS